LVFYAFSLYLRAFCIPNILRFDLLVISHHSWRSWSYLVFFSLLLSECNIPSTLSSIRDTLLLVLVYWWYYLLYFYFIYRAFHFQHSSQIYGSRDSHGGVRMYPIQFAQFPRISLGKVSVPGASLAHPEWGLHFPPKYGNRVMPYRWLELSPSMYKEVAPVTGPYTWSLQSLLNIHGGVREIRIKVALASSWARIFLLSKVWYYWAFPGLCLLFTSDLTCLSKPAPLLPNTQDSQIHEDTQVYGSL
jgi:hypothetical protein